LREGDRWDTEGPTVMQCHSANLNPGLNLKAFVPFQPRRSSNLYILMSWIHKHELTAVQLVTDKMGKKSQLVGATFSWRVHKRHVSNADYGKRCAQGEVSSFQVQYSIAFCVATHRDDEVHIYYWHINRCHAFAIRLESMEKPKI